MAWLAKRAAAWITIYFLRCHSIPVSRPPPEGAKKCFQSRRDSTRTPIFKPSRSALASCAYSSTKGTQDAD
uniref:Putative secreted peptide n=1 Tax=Anopheles braziliensis TaxID=58242 RepID=A0A2M3ZV97_9DIPT